MIRSVSPHSSDAPAAPALSPVVREHVRARTSDRVYDELASAIRDLRLAPGASLSETDLSARLQVSRTPVREAIARLVENGLVSVVPQVGTRVEKIRLSDVEQAQFVRENLEVAAFAAACKRPDRDTAGLRAIIAKQDAAQREGDVDAFFAADEAFHELIFSTSGYPGAWKAIQSMKLQLDRLRRLSVPDISGVAELIAEHAAIADALTAGDVRRGKALVSKHARRVLDYGPRLSNAHPELFTD
jgi:DNA-binding GntR family transcriptional regulator